MKSAGRQGTKAEVTVAESVEAVEEANGDGTERGKGEGEVVLRGRGVREVNGRLNERKDGRGRGICERVGMRVWYRLWGMVPSVGCRLPVGWGGIGGREYGSDG